MSSSQTLRLVKWPRHCPMLPSKVSLFDDLPDELVQLVVELMDLFTRCRFAQFSKDAYHLVTKVHGGLTFGDMPTTFYNPNNEHAKNYAHTHTMACKYSVFRYFDIRKEMLTDLVRVFPLPGDPRFITLVWLSAREVIEYLIDEKHLGSFTELAKRRQSAIQTFGHTDF